MRSANYQTPDRQIRFGAVLSYLSILLNIGAGLFYTPWMITQIGQADYGLYTLANSLITLFLLDFGLSTATSRYIAQYRAEGRQDKVDNFLGLVYRLYLIIDAVIFIVLIIVYLLIEGIYVNLTSLEIEKFKIIYVIAASFAVINFPFVTFNGILSAYEKFIQLKLADVLYRVLLIALTIFSLLAGYGVYVLVLAHAVCGLAVTAYKFVVIYRALPVRPNIRYRNYNLCKDIFSFSIWTTISAMAQRLVFNITPSILGVVASSSAIAVFGIVMTVEGYTYTITSAINGMFMPKVSRLYQTEHAEEKLSLLFLRVGRFQYALNGLVIAGFAVLGKNFIQLWMGSEYHAAYYGILLVTVPGLFFNSLAIANTALVVRKKVKLQAYVTVATGITNVVLSFIFSHFWGLIGACLSIFAAYTLRAILLNVIAWKTMQFDIPGFIRQCYVRMSVPIVSTILLGMCLNAGIVAIGWLNLFFKGVLTVIIYMFFLYLFGLQKNERNSFAAGIKAKLNNRQSK